jgi:hypothetical protein
MHSTAAIAKKIIVGSAGRSRRSGQLLNRREYRGAKTRRFSSMVSATQCYPF